MKLFVKILFVLVVFLNIYQPIFAANLGDAFPDAGKVAYVSGYQDTSLTTIIGTAISVMLSFLGVVFIGLMIYGGYVWMIAKGNEQEVTKAKQTITAAVIGLIIVMSAYAISYFVIAKLTVTTLII